MSTSSGHCSTSSTQTTWRALPRAENHSYQACAWWLQRRTVSSTAVSTATTRSTAGRTTTARIADIRKGHHNNGGRGGSSDEKRGRGGSGAGHELSGGAKWCSLHNTTNHTDQACLKQKGDYRDSVNFANIYSPHPFESPVNTTVVTKSEATGVYMGGYTFMASAATEPAPDE